MDQIRNGFANPGTDYRALPMDFDYAKPVEFAAKLKDGKWGGALFNYPHGGPGYLLDQDGWDQYTAAVEALKANGLNVWIYDEMGYPSGSAGGRTLKDHPEYEAQGLFYGSTDIAMKDTKEFEWRVPDGKPFYAALCELDWNGRLSGDPVDVTDKIKDGVLKLELKPGSWRLMAFVQNRLFTGTHASITFGPYINVMDPDAVKRFIDITHESYYAHYSADFGKTIKAIFNDEVSLMNGFLTDDTQPHPAIGWYHGLPEIFRKRNGYDIRECLPSLFNNAGQVTASRRADFYSTISETVGENFFGQIRKWCATHGVASTGHLVWEESLIYHANFYGSVFPSLKELDWPGIDVLGCNYGCTSGSHTEGGPVTPKLISSVAHLYGKKRTMTESFCFVTKETPSEELFAHIGWQWVLGINSLTALSIESQYPQETFRRFNDYTARLSYMLTQGRYTADVAILYPIASVWSDFVPTNRHVHNLDDNPKALDVDEAWREVSYEALGCQRDFDYLDEDAILSAKVSAGKLKMGQNAYSVLALPHVTTLKYESLKQIAKFVASGGTVVSYATLPYTREDAGAPDEQRALVNSLWDAGRSGKGKVIHVETIPALRSAMAKCGQPDLRVKPGTPDVYYQHRVLPDGDIYFLMNNSTKPVSGEFEFRASGKAEVWNPYDADVTPAVVKKSKEMSAVKLTLPGRTGRFVVFSR